MGDPPPLALATPRLRQEAFGICFSNATNHRGKSKRKGENTMNTTTEAESELSQAR
jgi:hypothetical protein